MSEKERRRKNSSRSIRCCRILEDLLYGRPLGGIQGTSHWEGGADRISLRLPGVSSGMLNEAADYYWLNLRRL